MPKFSEGDRVFVFKPAAKSCKAFKFARPFHGPYRIVTLYDTGAEVRLVDRPQDPCIHIPFDRLRVCLCEIPDESWPPAKATADQNPAQRSANRPADSESVIDCSRAPSVKGRDM